MLDIDERKVAQNEIGLWLGWTLATAAGMVLGVLPWLPFLDNLDLGLARVIVPVWTGLLVGIFQWLVLRGYLTHAVDWIFNGGAGWAVGYALGLLAIQNLSEYAWGPLLGYILFGLVIAILQWPVLRREIPNAIPWIIASVVGWALGASLSQIVLDLFVSGNAVNPAWSATVIAGTTGLVAGAITGLVLVWIVRQPEHESVFGETL